VQNFCSLLFHLNLAFKFIIHIQLFVGFVLERILFTVSVQHFFHMLVIGVHAVPTTGCPAIYPPYIISV
jgi:hypothetical protein